MNAVLTAEFIDSPDGRLFIVVRSPNEPPTGRAVLVVPALAEEMNKSRKLLTELGVALARAGRCLIVPDLSGTGDSEGLFENGSVELWTRNLDAIADWALHRDLRIEAIVGVRFGCLLAAHWMRTSGRAVACSVFWQPVSGGEQVVRQWFRMRVGAAMFDGSGKLTTTDLATRLEGGEALEIGGYFLTPTLALEMRSLELSELLGPALGRLHMFEVGDGPDVSAAVQRLTQGHDVGRVERLRGEPFWSATEIVVNADLIERTVQCLVKT